MDRVVISNVYADDNRGGAALTSAAIRAAKSVMPGAKVSLVTLTEDENWLAHTHRHTRTNHPDVELLPSIFSSNGRRLNAPRALLSSLRVLAAPKKNPTNPTLTKVQEATLVMGKGGQLFRHRASLREVIGLWLAAFPLLLARRVGVSTALYGVSIGPFPSNRLNRFLSGFILRRVDLVIVRDSRSRELAAELGVRSDRLRQVADTVISIPTPAREVTESLCRELGVAQTRFGAVAMTPHPRTEQIWIAKLLQATLDQGIVDRLVVVLHTDGPTTSDLRWSRELVDLVDDSRVQLISDDFAVRDLLALYRGAVLTLGSRVHATILSLMAGTPAFPVSRTSDEKARDIFSTFGLERLVLRIEGEPHEVASRMAAQLQDDSKLKADFAFMVDSAKKQHEATVASLREVLQCSGGCPSPRYGRMKVF